MASTAPTCRPTPNEPVTIAVLGVTGAGKSTFIKSVSNDPNITVGNTLASCTSGAEAYTFVYRGTTYRLVDTPGFDDTTRSDNEILNEIASWLSSNLRDVKLAGVIYLHRITDTRMGGTALRNLRTFQRILRGSGGLGSVVLATTFWDKVDEDEGARKEQELSQIWREGGSAVGEVEMRRLDGRRQTGLLLLRDMRKKHASTGSRSLDVSAMVASMEQERRRERERIEEEERRHRAHVAEMERQARQEMEARRQQAMRQRAAQRAADEERYRRLQAQRRQRERRARQYSDSDSDSSSDESCCVM